MSDNRSQPLVVAAPLAALAGLVDAIAYLVLGGFFASFMSGNTIRLGVGIVAGDAAGVWTASALLLAFVSGVMVAAMLAARFPARREVATMLAVTILLALAALLAGLTARAFPLILLAAAMGAENGVFRRGGATGIGLTFMTGELVRFGETLADALIGAGARFGWAPHLVLWLGFAAGGAIGAREFAWLGVAALWIGCAAAALLTGFVALLARRVPSR